MARVNQQAIAQLRRIETRIIQAPQRFRNALKGKQGRLANRTLTRLSTEPGPPVHPIRWKTPRQRRAFFASDGFGRGIPHQRGNYVQGWTVEFIPTSETTGEIVVYNPSPGTPFIQGDFQQPFHRDTGWVNINDVQEDFYKETSDDMAITWLEESNPF